MALVDAARYNETPWHTQYWARVLRPAVSTYCRSEALALRFVPDEVNSGWRWAGTMAAIRGMWYAIGPAIGLGGDLKRFHSDSWNREQRWMSETSCLMQMIDDWVDQDEDRLVRLTPVTNGDWTLQSAAELHGKTVQDLVTILDASAIRSLVLQDVVIDLYNDYLHAAIDAMRSGLAA